MTPFTIALDADKRGFRATLRGYWDLATVKAYVAELARRVAELDHGGGATYWLIDISEHPVQANEVAETSLRAVPRLVTKDAVVAVATSSALVAMQAQRVAAGHKQRRFDNVADAEAWLAKMRNEE